MFCVLCILFPLCIFFARFVTIVLLLPTCCVLCGVRLKLLSIVANTFDTAFIGTPDDTKPELILRLHFATWFV